MNKGARILVLSSGVLVVWGIMTVILSLHTIHQTHGHHHRRERESLTLSLGDRLDVGRVMDPRSAIQHANTRIRSVMGNKGFRPAFEERRAAQLRETEKFRSGGIQNVTPKVFTTTTEPMICVERDDISHRCRLHPCHHDATTTTTSADDYGFVQHQLNTRGLKMSVSGSAHAGSGCAISHAYKFIYIHVLKSGGMTIKAFLKKGLCRGSVQMPCAAGNDVLQIVDCGRAVIQYPEYFVFSFIRNPFGRIYSAYSMADSMKTKKKKEPVLFPDFVKMRLVERRQASMTSPSHYIPQVRFLFSGDHCPVFDYLGRLERFHHDLQVVLNQIQSPELQAYYDSAMKNPELLLRENCTSFGERKKQTVLGGKLSNAYETPGTVQAVVKEFASDFELLRYDPSQVP